MKFRKKNESSMNHEDFFGRVFLLRNGMIVAPRQRSSSPTIEGCEVTVIQDSRDKVYENGGFRVEGKIKHEISVTFEELTLGQELRIQSETGIGSASIPFEHS